MSSRTHISLILMALSVMSAFCSGLVLAATVHAQCLSVSYKLVAVTGTDQQGGPGIGDAVFTDFLSAALSQSGHVAFNARYEPSQGGGIHRAFTWTPTQGIQSAGPTDFTYNFDTTPAAVGPSGIAYYLKLPGGLDSFGVDAYVLDLDGPSPSVVAKSADDSVANASGQFISTIAPSSTYYLTAESGLTFAWMESLEDATLTDRAIVFLDDEGFVADYALPLSGQASIGSYSMSPFPGILGSLADSGDTVASVFVTAITDGQSTSGQGLVQATADITSSPPDVTLDVLVAFGDDAGMSQTNETAISFLNVAPSQQFAFTSMNDDQDIVFSGFASDGSQLYAGVWKRRATSGDLSQIMLSGDPAHDSVAIFSSLVILGIEHQLPVINNIGDIAFGGEIESTEGPREGVWRWRDAEQSLEVVALAGDPAVGIEDTVFVNHGFDAYVPSMNSSSHVAFIAAFDSSQERSTFRSVLAESPDGNLTLIAAEGHTINVAPLGEVLVSGISVPLPADSPSGGRDGRRTWFNDRHQTLILATLSDQRQALVLASFECAMSCAGDYDGSGTVDGTDLGILLLNWGANSNPCFDLDGDGKVDGTDLGIFLLAWGPCPGGE